MEQTPSDKRNITINFGKRHFGQLCNTCYRMPKYTDLYDNDTTYNLRVNLNDDSIVLKKKTDLTEDELTMLSTAEIEDTSDIFECKGTASLPEYTSDFYINTMLSSLRFTLRLYVGSSLYKSVYLGIR